MPQSPENLFNARIMSNIRLLGKSYYALKASDRFRAGISDFIIWHEGLTSTIEAKAIKALPARGSTLVLSHTFQGPQQTFMKDLSLAHVHSWGLVGVIIERKMVLIPREKIPYSGNFTRDEFTSLWESSPVFDFDDVGGMLNLIFNVARSDMLSLLSSAESETILP
jgi:hypothetical protein